MDIPNIGAVVMEVPNIGVVVMEVPKLVVDGSCSCGYECT